MIFKYMNKVTFFLMVLLMLGNVSCSDESETKLKIGFIVKQPEEPWFQYEWQFADKAAAQYGFKVIKIGAPDGEKVLTAIDNLAAGGAKGFVICTPDVHLGPAIMAKAKSHRMKVISVDDQFVGADGTHMLDVPYLGISAYQIGRSVGTALYERLQVHAWNMAETAVCAVTFDELDTVKQRTDGAIDALVDAGFPERQIYKASMRVIDQPSAFDAVNVLLTQQPDIKNWLVCGTNDSAVIAAVRALEGRGFNHSNAVGIGINGTDCLVEFEKTEPTAFYASILLTPKRHGFETAEMLFKWITLGTPPALDTRTAGILIHRDNFQTVMAENGLL